MGSFLWDSLQRGLSRGEAAAFSTCCQNLSELPAGLPKIEPELDFIATFRTYHFTLSAPLSALLIKCILNANHAQSNVNDLAPHKTHLEKHF